MQCSTRRIRLCRTRGFASRAQRTRELPSRTKTAYTPDDYTLTLLDPPAGQAADEVMISRKYFIKDELVQVNIRAFIPDRTAVKRMREYFRA